MLTPEQISELKLILEDKKRELEKELNEDVGQPIPDAEGFDFEPSFPEYGDDPDENAQEIAEYSANVDIENTLEYDLEQVNAALKRIEDHTYGICLDCNEPIAYERLKAFPEALYCIKCARKNEKI